jgi:hypothetical protein
MLPIGTDMLVGGQFTRAGAVAAANVVKLDGVTGTWVPYGAGVPGPVYGATLFNGQLFICGNFHFTASGKTGDSVARWDGVRWQVVGPAQNGGLQNPDPMLPLPATVPGNVFCLAVYNNTLYAGGDFAYAGLDLQGNPIECHHFARYNAQTGTWAQMPGMPLTAPFPYTPAIYAMRVYGNLLYLGGIFDNVGASFARTNGAAVAAVNGGVFKAFDTSKVFSMTQVGTELVIGGDFESSGIVQPAVSNNMVRWDGARFWSVADGGASGPVYSVTTHRGQLAAMGDFGIVAGMRVRGTVWYDGNQWRRMGYNCDAPIYAMKNLNNQLVVAGEFGRTPGDVQASGIATFNGTTWAPIGAGLQNGGGLDLPQIYGLSEYNGQLVATGLFNRSGQNANLGNIAAWDGARWNPLGQVDGPVYGAVGYRGQLFIAGDLVNYGNIAQYDGIGGYNAVTFGTDGPGLAVDVFQDRLIAGGAFGFCGGVQTGPIAQWNYDTETWSALTTQTFASPPGGPPPIPPQVNVIRVIDGVLYIGGNWPSMNPGGASVGRFAKYDTATRRFVAVGTGGPTFDVWSIHKFGDSIYVAGTGGAHVMAYNGTSWRTVDGGTDGNVFALGDVNGKLCAGGDFLTASGEPSAYFSQYVPTVPVSIATPPQGVTTCEGGSVTLTVTPAGTGPFTYQWKKNGTNIAGATAQSYTINPATPGDSGSYTCVVTNSCSNATSAAATVTIQAAATITTQPVGRTLCEGAALNLSVAATGQAPITYQWRLNGSPIQGATSSTYSVAAVTPAAAGDYTCVVTNPCVVRTSNAATVVVNTGAQITGHPQPQTLCAGQPLTLTVTASGTSPTYQWKRNNVNIEGATSATYSVPAAGDANAGSYTCTVSNSCNTQTSNAAVVTINQAAAITAQPQGGSTCSGGSFTFSVTASGSNLTYQWQRNNQNIAGATASSYTINPVGEGSAGAYRCVVGSSCGSVNSDPATLTVGGQGATITGQPQGAAVCRGAEVSLSVTVAGSGVSYQWQRNGADIEGATSSTYTIASVSLATAGTYRVVVTSACGTLTSDDAVVSFCGADFNCDEFVDFFDYLDFVDAYTGGLPGGDFNGDDFIDFFDYLDFTDAFTAGC